MMIGGMFFEMIGIGVILPVMAILSGEKAPGESQFMIDSFRARFSDGSLGLVIAAGLIGVYLVKNLFLICQAWVLQRFIFGVQESLSFRLLKGYLSEPYSFHLRRNSAQLIRNTVNEVSQYSYNVISPMMVVLTEGITTLGLLVLLLMIEPTGTCAVAALLGGVGIIYHVTTRKFSTALGKKRIFHEGLRIQQIQQSLGGIKEVKLTGSEDNFLDAYQIHNFQFARVARLQTVLFQLPRLILEVVGVTAFGVLIGVMTLQGRDFASVIPALAVIGAAAFRLIPSANRIMGSFNVLRYGHAIIDMMSAEMKRGGTAEKKPDGGEIDAVAIRFNSRIQIRDVSFAYAESKEKALNDITFEIEKNTSVGIAGKSGSGKSTLLDLILGLLEPSSGGILVDGKDIRENLRSWQEQIGYVPQSIYLSDESLRKNIAFGMADDQIDDARIDQVLRAAHLDEMVLRLPKGVNTFVGERGIRLSGGQRQRIGIARALYHNPSVLVFDEATSSLDNDSEERVMEAIRDLHGSCTVIIVAHRLSTIEHCDHLIRLETGRILEDKYS